MIGGMLARASAAPPMKRLRRSTQVDAVGERGMANNFSRMDGTDTDEEHQCAEQADEICTVAVLARSNNLVLADKAQKESEARRHFCNAHSDILAPFLVRTKSQSSAKTTAPLQRQLEWEPIPQPEQIVPHGIMRDYQLDSLTFLTHAFEHGMGAILGDEMGLGKTLQTIAFLAHLRFGRRLDGPFLVACPLTVLETWCSELKRWCPDFRVLALHTYDKEEKNRLTRKLMSLEFDVAITTYDVVKNKDWRSFFSRIVFRVVVADEGHALKNPAANQTHYMRRLRSQTKVILTGTPVQNNLSELHSLLEFVCPGMFAEERFAEAYDPQTRRTDSRALLDARRLLEVLMIRRMKSEVEKNLPPKYEILVNCPLSPMQLFWYRRLLVKDLSILEQLEGNEGGSLSQYKRLQSLVAQLRKAGNHPYLFKGAEDQLDTSLQTMVAASGKLALLDRLLVGLGARGHRTVIFSQYTMMLDILQDYMDERGWEFLRFDGSTQRMHRLARIHQFQQDKTASIMLMSTRSGGLGINLQSADTIVLFDSDWNPQADRQAMARVHRVGQTKPVFVYRLVSKGTVEERILQRADTKLALDRAVLANDVDEDKEAALRGTRGLFTILRSSVVGVETRAMSDAELQKLLDRTQPPMPHEVETASPTDGLFDVFSILGKKVPRQIRNQQQAQIGRDWRKNSNLELQAAAPIPPSNLKPKRVKAAYCLECKVADVQLESCGNPTCGVSFCLACLRHQKLRFPFLGERWQCPQHHCLECDRTSEQAGGGLFRCANCPRCWCEHCLPGGLAAHYIGTTVEASGTFGSVPSAAVLMRCQWCCNGKTSDFRRSAQLAARAREPVAPLNLTSKETVGSVDETFGFLDDPKFVGS